MVASRVPEQALWISNFQFLRSGFLPRYRLFWIAGQSRSYINVYPHRRVVESGREDRPDPLFPIVGGAGRSSALADSRPNNSAGQGKSALPCAGLVGNQTRAACPQAAAISLDSLFSFPNRYLEHVVIVGPSRFSDYLIYVDRLLDSFEIWR